MNTTRGVPTALPLRHMDETTEPSEQNETGRRVSRHPETDRETREARRELIATLLLTRTSYRGMVGPIREALGIEVGVSTIASDVALIRQRWHGRMTESFAAHVAEQMAYYDGLLRALTPLALRGDHNAVQDLLGVLDRRARLVGMDQPDKVLVGVGSVGGGANPDVASAWGGIPREEQVSRTQQIMDILDEALAGSRLPAALPTPDTGGDVIDLVDRLDPEA